jgi:NADPH:quinone reductase-like Zn-dependent oxidoreductase
MHAIIQTGYGAPSRVLRLEEVDQPALDDDRVLVRVRASSVNSSDWRQVRAHPYIIRLTLGLRRPRDGHIGGDYAGVVEAVGAKVSNLAVGDEVFGARTGAYADYVADGRGQAGQPQLRAGCRPARGRDDCAAGGTR